MMNAYITPEDWEMLSAYLDDQLPPSEKSKIEIQLAQRLEIQAAYQELRQLKIAFRRLPSKKAPRNYTLKPGEKTEKRSIFHFLVPAFGFSSAVAAILLVITIFFQLSPSGSMISQASEPAMLAMEQEAGQVGAELDTKPPIITWGSPGGVGVGGGGGGGSGYEYGIGGGPPAVAVEPPTPDGAVKIAGSENLVEESLPTSESAKIEKQLPGQAVPPLPIEQYDLISGIRPAEQRGKILSTPPTQSTIPRESEKPSGNLVGSPIQILLVILTIFFGTTAFYLSRKGKM